MKDLRILGPRETGKGILIEMDAGYISPSDPLNESFLKAFPNFFHILFPFNKFKIKHLLFLGYFALNLQHIQ